MQAKPTRYHHTTRVTKIKKKKKKGDLNSRWTMQKKRSVNLKTGSKNLYKLKLKKKNKLEKKEQSLSEL